MHNQSLFTTGETNALVDWVDEESSSVVQSVRVAEGVFTVGEVSRVRTSGGTFRGVIAASGKHYSHEQYTWKYMCIAH